MVLHRHVVPAAFLFLSLIAPSAVVGDPITQGSSSLTIVAGRLTFSGFPDDPFGRGDVSGSGFSLGLEFGDAGGAAGGEVNSGAYGTLTVGASTLSFAAAPLQLRFTARPGPTNGPPLEEGLTVIPVIYPFTLSGFLLVPSPSMGDLRYELIGQGTAQADWLWEGSLRYPVGVVLSFSSPALVPEPTSLLLLMTGAAALLRMKSR